MRTSILQSEQKTVIQINLDVTGIKNFLNNFWKGLQEWGAAAAAARNHTATIKRGR